MAVGYRCKNTVFAATAGAKTALVVAAPAGHGLELIEWSISFDGVTASAVPATVDVGYLTLAGAGTAGGSPPSPVQVRGKTTSGSAPTVTHNYTAEPTTYVVLDSKFISPNGGVYVYGLPLGREWESEASGGTNKAFAIRVNVTANVNVLVGMEVEAVG